MTLADVSVYHSNDNLIDTALPPFTEKPSRYDKLLLNTWSNMLEIAFVSIVK